MIRGRAEKQKKKKGFLSKAKALALIVFAAFFVSAEVFADEAQSVDCSSFDTIEITEIDSGTVKGVIKGRNGGATVHDYDEYHFVVESLRLDWNGHGESVDQTTALKTEKLEKQGDGTYIFESKGNFAITRIWDITTGGGRVDDSGWEVMACAYDDDNNKAICDFEQYSYRASIGKDALQQSTIFYGLFQSRGDTSTCSGLALYEPSEIAFPVNPEKTKTINCLDDVSGLFGWVSCPLLDTTRDFIINIYDTVVTDWLNLEPQLLARSGNEGKEVYNAWNTFRLWANVALVLILLIIILSQVTGFGISNYGIKKALPRLITAAILINLSYIICQAVVDLSNILGFGLKGIIEGELNAINQITTSSGVVSLGAGAILFVAGLVSAVFIIIFINPELLLFILAAFILAVIAILFLFITLGIRQALVVLVITVSPIAFACYVFPGTKSIYKKWFELFKGLLLSFPIATIMVYGGALLGKIMVTVWGDDLLATTGALVISVAPFFFIPKTITASLGAVNQAVASVRSGITNRAQRRLHNSGMAQDLKRSSQEKKLKRWAAMPGGSTYRAKADALDARKRRVAEYKNNPDLIRQEEGLARVREMEGQIDARNETVQDMSDNLTDALMADASDENTARITAYTNKLKETSEGRAQLARIFQTQTSGPGAMSDESFNAMMGSFGAEDIDKLRDVSPRMATYVEGVKNGTIGRGDYGSINVFNSNMLSNLTEESAANMDTADFLDIVNQINASPATRNSQQAVEFARIAENLVSNESLNSSMNSQKLSALNGANGFLTQRNDRIKATASSAFGAYGSMAASQLNAQAQADFNAAAAAGDAERMEAIAYAYRNAAANRTNDAAAAAARTNIAGWANGARAAAQANGHQDIVGSQLELINMSGHRIS